MAEYPIEVGDTVWTTVQILMLDGWNPRNNEPVLLKLPRKDQCKVIEIHDDNTFTVQVVGGMYCRLPADQIEGV